MNILQQEDIIKGLPDQALQEEAKSPSGQVPQFLVVSEIQRRTDMRSKYKDPNQQQPQGTIADQITQEGIASVQPQQQQPQQGQPPQGQPMQMRGGGMTPFMRKYAGGGVVRMQEGGITPNEMLQMDSQMMAQKYPFLSGSRDEILQGLSGIDPNDAGSISAMFGGAPEIDGVLQQVSNRNNLMSQDLSGGLGPAPMVENITAPSLLELDGVMTTTPDGIRPNSGNPSVGSLDSFSNAFREDAERAKNLLATLDDSTPQEKEAISNPVSVNLPRIRTLEEIAIADETPQMNPLASRSNPLPKAKPALSQFAKEYPSMPDGVNNALLRSQGFGDKEMSTNLADSLTAGNFGSPFETGQTIRASGQQFMDVANVPIKAAYNATADATGGIRNLLSGVFGGKETNSDDEFRYDTMSKFSDSNENGVSPTQDQYLDPSLSATRFDSSSVSGSANNTFNMMDSLKPVNKTSTSVSTDTTNSGVGVRTEEQQLKAAEKGASLLDKLLGLGLEGDKKQAYAMALMALGKGISDGDTAGGLQNAGLAANAIMEQSADRRDKQLDREMQSDFYKNKLQDARDVKKSDMNYKIQTLYTKYLETAIGATEKQKSDELDRITRSITGNLGDTVATGSSLGGGNQRDFSSLNT